MNNYNVFKGVTLALGATASVSASAAAATATSAKEQKPNIIVILVDDLGWNDLGCMGSKFYETPNIDALAKRGVTFTNAYAACQVSSPSRASLLTGRYTPAHDITNFIGAPSGEAWRKRGRNTKMLPPEYTLALPHELTTLPEHLRDNGYATFMAGKWHLGGEGSTPCDHGFEINVGGWESGGPRGGYFSPWENPELPNLKAGENLSMRLSEESANFIGEHRATNPEKPFFIYLSFYAVHAPIETTESNWRHYRDKADSMGIAKTGFAVNRSMPERQHQDNPVYAGLVQQMDSAVGHLLNSLEELGVDDNTLVIFTSDNGGVVSGDNFSTSLKPLRGGKGMQWEGGIRVPMIVSYPNNTTQSLICDTPVSGIDIFATCSDIAGTNSSKIKSDGVSFAPLLSGGNIKERALFWHYPHYGNQGGEPSSIIRDGEWKLIFYHEDGRNELYNLSIDISEMETLNHLYPEKVKVLSAKLGKWLKANKVTMPYADSEYSPQKEAAVKQRWRTSFLERREQDRREMLSPEWQPNATWWGSKTID